MNEETRSEKEALGIVPPGHPLGEARKAQQPPGAAGPTSPGSPEPKDALGPESGGYDNRPPIPQSDNAKGGYGAG